MRYNLGYIDKYPLEAVGSSVENIPMFRAVFTRPIDPVRLEEAARNAIISYPLFGTKVEFDREYYLRTNELPLVILNCKEDERPDTLGKNTNYYPWRLCYDDCTLIFEWLHGITDGMGALSFFKQVLLCYFGYKPEQRSLNFMVAPGLEPFIDRKEKGINFSTDPAGFSFRKFPPLYNDYRTDMHHLVCDTSELLSLSKNTNSSVSLIIPIIFSRALRLHLPKEMKNRNVACNIALDLRRTLRYETQHNCVDLKRITYIDEYDNMSFTDVAKRYKEKLDNARLVPNIVRSLTERVALFSSYHLFPSRLWLKFCSKIIGKIFKNTDCNIGITYAGKVELPPEVAENIESLDLKVWHDFGQCCLSALDYNDCFHLHVAENFKEKGVVEDFMRMSSDLGIHWKVIDRSVFKQTHFVEK